MYPRLQPYVSEAATLCIPGCNPMCQRLQPYVSQAATLGIRGCNPMLTLGALSLDTPQEGQG